MTGQQHALVVFLAIASAPLVCRAAVENQCSLAGVCPSAVNGGDSSIDLDEVSLVQSGLLLHKTRADDVGNEKATRNVVDNTNVGGIEKVDEVNDVVNSEHHMLAEPSASQKSAGNTKGANKCAMPKCYSCALLAGQPAPSTWYKLGKQVAESEANGKLNGKLGLLSGEQESRVEPGTEGLQCIEQHEWGIEERFILFCHRDRQRSIFGWRHPRTPQEVCETCRCECYPAPARAYVPSNPMAINLQHHVPRTTFTWPAYPGPYSPRVQPVDYKKCFGVTSTGASVVDGDELKRLGWLTRSGGVLRPDE